MARRLPGTPLGPLGDLLGTSWEPLGSLLGALGSSWEPLGGLLRRLGSLVGRQEGPEGVTLAILGRSWSALGASWSALGLSWRHLGRLLGAFWSYLATVLQIKKHLDSDSVEYCKTMKNTVRYCKNRGSEQLKIMKSQVEKYKIINFDVKMACKSTIFS